MIKQIRGVVMAIGVLAMLGACGKAETELPNAETGIAEEQAQQENQEEDQKEQAQQTNGSEQAQTDQKGTETADGKEDPEASERAETPDIPEDAVRIHEVGVRLLNVEENESILLMRRTFEAYGDQRTIEKIFRGSNVVMEKDENEQKVIVTETAFFTSEDEVWKLSCLLDGEGEEYTFEKGQVTPIEQKEFLVSTESGDEAVVILTPYGVWIQATDNWMAMSEAYQFTAELTDGSEEEIAILPLARSRQARSQEMKELPGLGDGYVMGEELQNENGDSMGGRFIFWEEISLDDIVDIHIYQ